MACPVITTTTGAMGFPIRNGVQAMLADTADEFKSALRTLISSREQRRTLGARGREMIVEEFGWEQIGRALLEVVENVPRISRIGKQLARIKRINSVLIRVNPSPN